LRLLVMSATLDGGPVAEMIGDAKGAAPVITSEGRAFPVATVHVPRRADQRVEALVAATIRRALGEHQGDVLAFLPGAGEIARTARLLDDDTLPAGAYVAPLHGSLDEGAQDLAIAPSRAGERKIVLATTIAQTSLTIDGVRIVVDSGMQRVPRFSPRTGMSRLETVRVSHASAEQRRGRAGRTAPGMCYRLWDEHEHHGLLPFDRPEILEADLAPLALELASAGITRADALQWLDAPPAASLAQAGELLRTLGAVDSSGRITAHGRKLATLAAHPRVAHMLLHGLAQGEDVATVACDLAALLGQRDILRFGPAPDAGDADVRLRLEVLHDLERRGVAAAVPGGEVDRGAARHAMLEARQWRRTLRIPDSAGYRVDAAGQLLAAAYPERIAQRRTPADGVSRTRYLLRNGSGAELTGTRSLAGAPFLAVAELGGAGAEPRIRLAAPLTLAELHHVGADSIERELTVEWDDATGTVQARERTRIGAIVIADSAARAPDPDALLAALLAGIRSSGLLILPWSPDAAALRERMAFAQRAAPADWPDVSDAALLGSLEEWLAPSAYGRTGRQALAGIDLRAALESLLPWNRRQELDRFAPSHWEVPSGSRIRIDYAVAEAPVLAVRLQEVFGLHETPRIAGGRVPLTVHLLSPAHRPVQVTQDLAGFWRTGYFDVKKEMKGRYPKHYWPDDPLVAEPRRTTRKR
ncbi:MAG: ATP-dependent helicase HrpB, partial [Gemmatimonadaceae bacterium]|nr:ATP-dependent helicase HrpB [Gemmatimonadaceae bacterium]